MEESMQESFATMQKQYIERGEKFVSDLLGQEVNFSNPSGSVPEVAQDTINNFQNLVEQGQQQVLSTLEDNTQGSSDGNPIASFGVGNSNDTLTGSGQGDSSNAGYAINFVPAKEGTGEIGQVQFQIGEGEPTTLFTLGSAGPVNQFSSGDQQGGFGGMNPFSSSDQQGGFGGMNPFGGQGSFGGSTM